MIQAVQRPRGRLGFSPRYSHLRFPSDVTEEDKVKWEKEYNQYIKTLKEKEK